MTRESYNSGAKWEPIVGYARAVRVGDVIEVSGTVAVDDQGNPVEVGDAYGQTHRILMIIQKAIEKCIYASKNGEPIFFQFLYKSRYIAGVGDQNVFNSRAKHENTVHG